MITMAHRPSAARAVRLRGSGAGGGISLQGTTAFADAGQRCLTTAISPELGANEACNGRRPVCQTGAQRVSGRAEQGHARSRSRPPIRPRRRTADRSDERTRVSVRVPGGFALITMAHRSSAARAVRLRGSEQEAGVLFTSRPRSRMPALDGVEDPRRAALISTVILDGLRLTRGHGYHGNGLDLRDAARGGSVPQKADAGGGVTLAQRRL